MSKAQSREELVRVRRAPKLAPFAVIGMAVGFTITVLLTALFPSDPSIGFGTLAGYFSLFGTSTGLAIGLIVWLVLDRRSKMREKEVRMERESN